MQGFRMTVANLTVPRFSVPWIRSLPIVSAAALVLPAAISQAQIGTPEEVEKILAVLDAENCEISRDAMGEKMLSIKEGKFIVEATCADDKHYSITLGEKFEILQKTVVEY